MSHEIHEHHDPTPPQTAVVRDRPARPVGLPSLSWGAVFAGLFVVLALGWLLEMLGIALGFSIADATDSMTMGGTLGPAVSIWLLVCWLVSFFVGALVTARLAGRIDDTSGMLHGLTLWAVSTVVTVVIGYYGLMSVMNTGQAVLGQAAQGVGAVASATASGVQSAASGTVALTQQVTDRYGEQIQDRLFDRAAEIAAAGTEEVTEQEIRRAVNALDDRTLRRIVIDLTNNDSEGAAELVAEQTKLSQTDAKALVDSAYRNLEQQFGNPDNQKSLAGDVKSQLVEGVDSYLAGLDERGGPQVTEQDIQSALNDLDADAAQDVGMRLINGDTQGAKRILARNTDLSVAQINDLVDGAQAGITEEIEAYQEEFEQTVEAASTYVSEILWLIFAGAAAALAASIAGGYLGADSSRRLYPDADSHEVITRV